MIIPGGPAPLDEATVLSPAWLTAVLRARWPGVVVRGTQVTERLETVATKVRFTVDYAEPVPGAPPALCVKGYFNPALGNRVGGGATEVRFYQAVAPGAPVRTPPCVYAAIDDDTGHGLILMEDLVAAGATFLDPLGAYTPERAAGTVEQLAALHAAFWEKPPAGRPAAVRSATFPPRLRALADVLDPGLLQTQLDDGRAADLPAAVRDARRVRGAMLALAEIGAGGGAGAGAGQTLVHGDVHTGNVYELADGRCGLIDWQVVQRGPWALDVAYHLGAVLDPDDRAKAERGLVEHYRDCLAARGVTPPSGEDAWWQYRAHLPYGFFLWSITRAVDRPVIEHLTGRLGLATAQHASLDLLGV